MAGHAVLFDLDGTLTNSVLGITRSIEYALERMALPIPPVEVLRKHIGPPLWDAFSSLFGTDDRRMLDEAVRIYRERYADVGMFENEVFDGIPEALTQLADEGFALFVATSKAEVYSRRITDHFGLSAHFAGLYGSELDGTRSDKGDLIAYVLKNEGLSPDGTIMIGDRKHDIAGARANGVAAVGVTYGFGSREELEAAAPEWLAKGPGEIVDCVKSWSGEAT